MNSFNSDYFIHVANVLLLLAYSVRDILWLRLFALASSLIAMTYFFLQPTPLWAPLGWSTLFAAINRARQMCRGYLTHPEPNPAQRSEAALRPHWEFFHKCPTKPGKLIRVLKAQEHLRDAVTVNRMALTSDVVLAIADCQFCQFRHSTGAPKIPTRARC